MRPAHLATYAAIRIAKSFVDPLGNLILSPPLGGGFNQFRNHGPRDQCKVALTFDDGPSRPSSEALLDALDELDVQCTWFCTGINVMYHPDLVERAYNTGHIIGNHSIGHERGGSLSFRGGDHIDLGEVEIAKVIGVRPRLYRPPWGWLTPWEGARLIRRGYTIIGWDVYTLDWQFPEKDGYWLAKEALNIAQNGSIFLFHDAVATEKISHKKEMIRAVQCIVPEMRSRGYEFRDYPGTPKRACLWFGRSVISSCRSE
jgi:peptidoglycan/xylan/chitin deacetylase (PgdA/CDA1 family)